MVGLAEGGTQAWRHPPSLVSHLSFLRPLVSAYAQRGWVGVILCCLFLLLLTQGQVMKMMMMMMISLYPLL